MAGSFASGCQSEGWVSCDSSEHDRALRGGLPQPVPLRRPREQGAEPRHTAVALPAGNDYPAGADRLSERGPPVVAARRRSSGRSRRVDRGRVGGSRPVSAEARACGRRAAPGSGTGRCRRTRASPVAVRCGAGRPGAGARTLPPVGIPQEVPDAVGLVVGHERRALARDALADPLELGEPVTWGEVDLLVGERVRPEHPARDRRGERRAPRPSAALEDGSGTDQPGEHERG